MSLASMTSTDVARLRVAEGPAGLQDAVYGRLPGERIVFLRSEADDDIADRVCAQMLLLAAADADRDISLYINSPGGSVSAGMAIRDTMRFLGCDVATYTWDRWFTPEQAREHGLVDHVVASAGALPVRDVPVAD
jgi:ATP-dependent Clp protease protease subunit